MTIQNQNSIQQSRQREKEQAVFNLLTVYEGTPLRLVDNLTDVVSNGNTFSAFGFSVEFSPNDGETLQTIQLVFDNTTLEMIDWIRSFTSPIPIKLETVFSGDLDYVEQSISELVIRSVKYDVKSITATLSADDDVNQLLPSDTYNSLDWPGLF